MSAAVWCGGSIGYLFAVMIHFCWETYLVFAFSRVVKLNIVHVSLYYLEMSQNNKTGFIFCKTKLAEITH